MMTSSLRLRCSTKTMRDYTLLSKRRQRAAATLKWAWMAGGDMRGSVAGFGGGAVTTCGAVAVL